MKQNARKAFNELKALGVPVVEFDHYGGHFQLSAEEDNSSEWVDYYNSSLGDFGIHNTINGILDKHGLFAEWQDAAIASVWDV